MKCPTDQATLVMSERNGIEIDYCPECRGVWLDRGELDKIIERNGEMSAGTTQSTAFPPQQSGPTQQQVPPQQYGRPFPQQGWDGQGADGYGAAGYGRDGDGRDGYGRDGYRKKKRENWLSDLFD